MRILKLTVAYDGTDYVGFQRQSTGMSIQQRLEEAVAPLAGDVSGRGGTVTGAGRTDAGVHALGQVVSLPFDSDLAVSVVQRALNARLPPDIRVVGVVEAPSGFHARMHATGKVYRYRIARGPFVSPFDRWFVWHVSAPRDVGAMRRAAAALVGQHDFASFQASGSSVRHSVRTLRRIDIIETDSEIVVEVEGDGFLRHMVRILVGTLDEVGAGSRPAESLPAVIAARDRSAGGPTAPASGLTLVTVKY